MDELSNLTELLNCASTDDNAKERLYELVYDDLRSAAHAMLYKRRQSEVQTTMLVNEVVLKFEKANSLENMANRRVFFAVASRAMKNVIIDQYRRRRKAVDSPDREIEPLDSAVMSFEKQTGLDLNRLSEALAELKDDSPRQHAVIMHRFFGDRTVAETAELLNVSIGTVERDWRLGRAKLYRAMNR